MLKRTKFQTNPTKLKLELVVWEDITSRHNGWEEYTEESIAELELDLCYTPGWVVYEDDKILKMVSGFSGADEEWAYSFDGTIPVSLIKERTVLLEKWTY